MKRDKILNIGCGNSTYGTHFIDLYPQRKGVIKFDVENGDFPFANNYFDQVFTENIFEHLKNPNIFLNRIYKILKRDGKITLITDNASFWGWHFPGAKTHYGEYEKLNKYGCNDCHYALYTSWHLINHFKKTGFRNIKYVYLINTDRNPLVIRILSLFVRMLSKRMSYPQIKITATK